MHFRSGTNWPERSPPHKIGRSADRRGTETFSRVRPALANPKSEILRVPVRVTPRSVMRIDGNHVPVVTPSGCLTLEDVKRRAPQPLISNNDATLWDTGDGIACLELTTQPNMLTPDVVKIIDEAIALGKDERYRGLVIGNDSDQPTGPLANSAPGRWRGRPRLFRRAATKSAIEPIGTSNSVK